MIRTIPQTHLIHGSCLRRMGRRTETDVMMAQEAFLIPLRYDLLTIFHHDHRSHQPCLPRALLGRFWVTNASVKYSMPS